ncbi:type VI secretion system tube protein Hcp [Raoultella sp. Lac2]|uniref:Type VI secretion system tube protein TssD n=1 Tax=Klebsiella electrica TaxID=1259973 RepID=A0AAJ5QUN1_9ENTR|nr:type VI secretion system tube protein TssD [Klebsiella electrica]MXF45852.1 type VI secretion system tube protein Hcp [Raoultella sp. Lac2]MXG00367.1 type VI secretion system tube protein Hcp [Raoultella sp. Lac1]WBW60765.1 type VI secretion system tube protein TssD [Klebsiella electrica]WIO43783.1 type VI secretion system tube protein TssD [Klebsiella electrica]
MSNPACLWFTDENGSPIVGGSMVLGREGSIEIKSLSHHLAIPTDRNTGKLTGTRIHTPILIQKEFDRTTPLLARAICKGITLRSAEIKMYRINEAGFEVEYFNILLENVKVTGVTPSLHPGAVSGTHLENIELRYETIQWKYTDGNIIFKDGWNERATA